MTMPRILPFLLLVAACKTNPLAVGPRPDDPLDGYQGTLAQSGVNTEMDWGPKQEYLLSGYKELREDHESLKRQYEEQVQQNQSLKAAVANESEALQRERTLRAQAEAEVRSLQQKRRELEARILSVAIEKSKLEQSALLAKIAELQRSLEDLPPAEETPAAPPGGRR